MICLSSISIFDLICLQVFLSTKSKKILQYHLTRNTSGITPQRLAQKLLSTFVKWHPDSNSDPEVMWWYLVPLSLTKKAIFSSEHFRKNVLLQKQSQGSMKYRSKEFDAKLHTLKPSWLWSIFFDSPTPKKHDLAKFTPPFITVNLNFLKNNFKRRNHWFFAWLMSLLIRKNLS